ncbi:unnamed protein product [Camellia sinensis]
MRSQKPYVVKESDEALEDNKEEPQPHGIVEEQEESEIVESDLEFEGEIVEPDNDLPQKVVAGVSHSAHAYPDASAVTVATAVAGRSDQLNRVTGSFNTLIKKTGMLPCLSHSAHAYPDASAVTVATAVAGRSDQLNRVTGSFNTLIKKTGMLPRTQRQSKPEETIECLTQAILLNPTSAFMYATRVLIQIRLKGTNPVAWHGQCLVNGERLLRVFTWLNPMHKKLRNTVGSMRSCAKNERKERLNVRDNVIMLKLRSQRK